jgi:acyl carrier protein
MTLEDVSARVKEQIASITGIPATTIGDDAAFQQDLGLDSLSLLELVVHLEYDFKIKVPEHELLTLRTVADTARYVHDRIAAGR